MSEPVWLDRSVIIAVHGQQLAEHGGSAGVRDEGLLDSALSRPLNLVAYGTPEIADLAAAYGFGIARNHPFIDGNKRTAFVAVERSLGPLATSTLVSSPALGEVKKTDFENNGRSRQTLIFEILWN